MIENWTAPKVAPRSPQDGPRAPRAPPKTAQDRPRWAQEPPRSAQDRPRWPQDGPRCPPGPFGQLEMLSEPSGPVTFVGKSKNQLRLAAPNIAEITYRYVVQKDPRTFRNQHIKASELPSLRASEPPCL